jgi:RNA-binding protein
MPPFRQSRIRSTRAEAAPVDVREAGAALSQRVEGAHLVQTIGRTAVLYRPHPTKPEIRLPREKE